MVNTMKVGEKVKVHNDTTSETQHGTIVHLTKKFAHVRYNGGNTERRFHRADGKIVKYKEHALRIITG